MERDLQFEENMLTLIKRLARKPCMNMSIGVPALGVPDRSCVKSKAPYQIACPRCQAVMLLKEKK